MIVSDDNNVPEFYSNYVKDVLKVIKKNAELEFECLWREAGLFVFFYFSFFFFKKKKTSQFSFTFNL